MTSIQGRLTFRLLVCVLTISMAGSLAVYLIFRSSMIRQFDDGLRTEANSIATLFVRDGDGHYEFRNMPDIETMFRHGNDADVYCIRRMDGTLVVKSSSLGNRRCPGISRPAGFEGFAQVNVEGERHHDGAWRAIFLTFIPPSEVGVAKERFQIVLAAEGEEISHLLERLLWALALVAGFGGTATAFLVIWTVRKDLSPLRALAEQASTINSDNLQQRFALCGAPRELDPIHRALNGLLDRMETALKREQRFNADVAHELRTPVAELRSLSEVALSGHESEETLLEALRDARDIGVQLDNTISALLALRRCEPRILSSVDLVPALREAWHRVEATAVERNLAMTWQIPDQAHAVSDPVMLLAVLQNLFENATAYTQHGGEIACTVRGVAARTVIAIRNRPHGLNRDDVAHLFEPFWRKETARTDGAHVGLGLALAEAYCRACGATLHATLLDDGWLEVAISMPSRPG
ncbi:ATP-binding protein [Rhizomicrobium electricum]|uniref:histidine kinase n=1 Tax=Rhizomicrobium electricum TaxID=480070 RepID=A0ABN1F9W4_9PROT|nr:ATP-binding protein [Rhizomicrobium electricum]NIJ50644.1 two-component system sensor histidine kinase QseC [Rhizomicrobium electricum]